LITQETNLIYLVDERREKLKESIRYHCNALGNRKYKENEIGLILDGKILQHALAVDCQTSFLELLVSCKTVICCRATPKNKAQIVEFIKTSTKSVTLAIGDGANDVSMIQAAHVGIGIYGREGTQALSASDYAIGKFRFLSKLLFVHGIWNYKRLCKVILYSFYKNICLYVIELWFALSNGFSGQILFERWLIGLYNVLFTAAPPLALGLFDRPSKASTMLRFPELYKISQNKSDFNLTVFWTWMFNAFLHSIFLYFICYGIFQKEVVFADGQVGDYLFMGTHVYSYCVIAVCLKSGLETDSWTWITHLSIWGSIGFWFLFLAIYSQLWPIVFISPDMTGMFQNVFRTPVFWLGLIFVPVLVLLPDIIYKALQRTMFKTEAQAIQENEVNDRDIEPVIKMSKRLTETARLLKSAFSFTRIPAMPAQTTRYRGYAFSQEEHGAVTQADLIRTYNSKDDKPSGN
jgi:phospholipid-transporting ATPase